jgi:tripartite ATP-independent transporter DctM subunit
MELYFLVILIILMAVALGSGYPVAFALPGSAILTFMLAASAGYLFEGNVDAYFHSGGPSQWMSAGVTNMRGVYWEVERDTLIAIPLFIFMGIMLQRSKIAEDLLVTMAQLFGPVPGGLGISVVFVGALLAATTGIVGATVVAMGLISLPAMLRNNYSPQLATGTIAASGTLGQIIPPSIVLIILADQLASATDQASTMRKALYKEATGEISMPSIFDLSSTSAGEMFLGAFVPGLVLVGLYMAYILVFALINPKSAPAVHYEGKFDSTFWKKVAITLVPPLTLIFLVLGSIVAGIATVNQAGAIGAAGAMVMAGYRLTEGQKNTYYPAILGAIALILLGFVLSNYNMNLKGASTAEDWQGIYIGLFAVAMLLISLIWSAWRVLTIEDTMRGVMLETAKTTSLVFIILFGAAMLTAAFRSFGGEDLVKEFLLSLPGGFWSQFVIVMAVIFILGFFLDFIEIAVVVVPIVAPILLADPGANITAVWLGVMIGLNIQTSFLTPPFGFALFYLRGVAPATVKTLQIYKGVVAFIVLQLVALLIVGLYPPLVNYLPNRVSYTAETAPPPRNPRLQMCLEQYVDTILAEDGGRTIAAIDAAKKLDLSYLPVAMAKDLSTAFQSATDAIATLDEAHVAAAAVEEGAEAYRPQQTVVRRIEKDIRRHSEHAETLKKEIDRMREPALADARAKKEAVREELLAEIERLKAEIPAAWKEVNTTFKKLTKAEDKARSTYRRQADASVEQVAATAEILRANDAYFALESTLTALEGEIRTLEFADGEARVKEVEDMLSPIAGAGDVKSALSKARRALRGNNADRDKALEEYASGMEAYRSQFDWRKRAASELLSGLEAYLNVMSDSIGARMNNRMTREQALFLASCTSHHNDLSLYF